MPMSQIFKSRLNRSLVAVTFVAALAFMSKAAGAAEATAQMAAAREACIADASKQSENLFKLINARKAAGENEKAARLQERYDEVMRNVAASCKKIVEDEMVIARNAEKGKELDAKGKELDVAIEKERAKGKELDKLKKEGDEIGKELRAGTKLVEDYANGKATREQYQEHMIQFPQFLVRVHAYIAHSRRVQTDKEGLRVIDSFEKAIQSLESRVSSMNTVNAGQKK